MSALAQWAFQMVAFVLGQVGPATVADQQALYRRAADAIVSGSYAAARADATALAAGARDDARATALLIVADFLSGHEREGRALYAACEECRPRSVDAITRAAILQGRAAPFFSRLSPQLHEPYPDGPQPFAAVREASAGRYRRAAAMIAPLVQASPARPDVRFDRGVLLIALGDRKRAAADFAVAAVIRPTLPDAGIPAPLDPAQQTALWALSVLVR